MEHVLKIIKKYINPKIEVSLIKPDDNLSALGIDSLNFLLLVLDLEAVSNGSKLDPKMIAKLRTVQDLVEMVKIKQMPKV